MSKITKVEYAEDEGRIFTNEIASIKHEGQEFGVSASQGGLTVYLKGGNTKFHVKLNIMEEIAESIKLLLEGHKELDSTNQLS